MPTAGLVAGRFDADADIDFIVTSEATSRLMFLRNQGNFTFTIDTIGVNTAYGVAALDYDDDGDLDLVTANRFLHDNGVTVMLNDGMGGFRTELSCYPGFANGIPLAIVTSDFDLDGKADVAVAGRGFGDSVFVLYNLGGGITGAGGGDVSVVPSDYLLSQNYPNPFNPSTTIAFEIPAGTSRQVGTVSLRIYDVLGRETMTLMNEEKPAGRYSITWDGRNSSGNPVASGVYFYRMEVRERNGSTRVHLVRKMLLVR
jgi:hypothetical protein